MNKNAKIRFIITGFILLIILGFVMSAGEIENKEIINTEKITYTSSTKTNCSNNLCKKTFYTNTRFAKENNTWKKIEEINSLKDSGFKIKFIEVDENYNLEVIDFNYTHIKLKLDSKIIKDTNLKIWNRNDSKEKEYLSSISTKEKDYLRNLDEEIFLKETYKETYNLEEYELIGKEDFGKEFIYEFSVGKILEFGDNSTTLQYNFSDESNIQAFSDGICFDSDPPENNNPPITAWCDSPTEITSDSDLDSSDDQRVAITIEDGGYFLLNVSLTDILLEKITLINWTSETRLDANTDGAWFYLWDYNNSEWDECASYTTELQDIWKTCTNSSDIYFQNNISTFLIYGYENLFSRYIQLDYVVFEVEYLTEIDLNITNPTTSNPLDTSEQENISVYFNFLNEESNVTSGVTIDNVFIGGVEAEILTIPIETDYTTKTCTDTFGVDCAGGDNDASFDGCDGTLVGLATVSYSEVNGTIFKFGDTINATCQFYDQNLTTVEQYIYYHNGTAWEQIDSRSSPACDSCNWSVKVTLDSIEGTHYIRCINDLDGEGDSCANVGSHYDNDDVNFTVVSDSPINQFTYVSGVGWQTNITVPSEGFSGLKDLFINATYEGITANDTQTNAIDYGGSQTNYSINITNDLSLSTINKRESLANRKNDNNLLFNGEESISKGITMYLVNNIGFTDILDLFYLLLRKQTDNINYQDELIRILELKRNNVDNLNYQDELEMNRGFFITKIDNLQLTNIIKLFSGLLKTQTEEINYQDELSKNFDLNREINQIINNNIITSKYSDIFRNSLDSILYGDSTIRYKTFIRNFILSINLDNIVDLFYSLFRVNILNLSISDNLMTESINLDITNPTTSNPKSASAGDNITAYFNLLDHSTNITSDVSIEKVFVGGIEAEILIFSQEPSQTEIFFEDFEDDWDTTTSASCPNVLGTGGINGDFNGIDSNSNNYYGCASNYSDMYMSAFHTGSYGLVLTHWSLGASTNTDGLWYNFNPSTSCVGGECTYININFWSFEYGSLEAGEECWITEQIDSGTPSILLKLDKITANHTFNSVNMSESALSSSNASVRIMCKMSGWVTDVSYFDDFNITGVVTAEGGEQFVYVENKGWQVNLTIPSGISGLQDLFINATYDGNTASNTQIEAIDYGGIYLKNIIESILYNDFTERIFFGNRDTLSDLNYGDSVTKYYGFIKLIENNLGYNDLINILNSIFKRTDTNINYGDSVINNFGFSKIIGDNIGYRDLINILNSIFKNQDQEIVYKDGIQRTLGILREKSDGLSYTDLILEILGLKRDSNSNLQYTDETTEYTGFSIKIFDNVELTNIIDLFYDIFRTQTDEIAYQDETIRNLDLFRDSSQEINYQDGVIYNIVDEVQYYFKNILDNINYFDNIKRNIELKRENIQQIELNGITKLLSSLFRDSNNNLHYSDKVTRQTSLLIKSTDNLGFTDIIDLFFSLYRIQTDELKYKDELDRNLGITKTLEDELKYKDELARLTNLERLLSNNLKYEDLTNGQYNTFRIFSDNINLTDLIEINKGYLRDSNQELKLNNIISRAIGTTRNIQDEFKYYDEINRYKNTIRAFSSALSLTNIMNRINGLNVALNLILGYDETGYAGLTYIQGTIYPFGGGETETEAGVTSGGGIRSLVEYIFDGDDAVGKLRIWLITLSIIFLLLMYILLDLIRRRKKITIAFEVGLVSIVLLILGSLVLFAFIWL